MRIIDESQLNGASYQGDGPHRLLPALSGEGAVSLLHLPSSKALTA